MASNNETKLVSKVLDCTEENYCDLPYSESGEISSGEEEYDLEFLWFDDYSRQVCNNN